MTTRHQATRVDGGRRAADAKPSPAGWLSAETGRPDRAGRNGVRCREASSNLVRFRVVFVVVGGAVRQGGGGSAEPVDSDQARNS